MITSLIIFVISTSIACFLVWDKIVFIRKNSGGDTAVNAEDERLFADFSTHELRASIVYYAKIYGHRFVLSVLKQWIKFSFWIKTQRERFFPKKESFTDGENEPNPNSLSKSLSILREYKNHLKHVAKKVKEREERKRDM